MPMPRQPFWACRVEEITRHLEEERHARDGAKAVGWGLRACSELGRRHSGRRLDKTIHFHDREIILSDHQIAGLHPC